MSTKPIISVITVNFNGAKTLNRLTTVMARLLKDPRVEHVIIDGLSTDRSVELLSKYASSNPRVTFVSERDSGMYDAMNKGVSKSQGEYFIHLNSDDEPINLAYWNQIATLLDERKPLVHATAVPIVRNGKVARILPGRPFGSLHRRFGYHFPHQGTFFKRELFTQVGGYHTHIGYIADKIFCYELLDRIHDKDIVFDTELIAIQHAGGVSSESWWTPFRTFRLVIRSAKLIQYRNAYSRALINPIFKIFSALLSRAYRSKNAVLLNRDSDASHNR